MTDQPLDLDAIEARAADCRAAFTRWLDSYSPQPGQEILDQTEGLLEEDVPAMADEIRRLRAELAEEKAAHNPRLRGLLVKAAPDKDLYVQWSTVCDMPGGVFSRQTALEYGFPPSRLAHADKYGSSSHIGDGAWDDKGFVAEQRGWLRRELIGDYAVEYLHGDRVAAYALLEPFADDSKGDESAARP
ncbi:hypothetical protein [Streptomyces griseosporeus]|uniref:hypothetical protein n=1 Tax=Streptomyces griseosporeus TaxID=1910 RepID=UPI0036FB6845